jgi:hypothetical protein
MQKEEFPSGVTKNNKKSVAKKSASLSGDILPEPEIEPETLPEPNHTSTTVTDNIKNHLLDTNEEKKPPTQRRTETSVDYRGLYHGIKESAKQDINGNANMNVNFDASTAELTLDGIDINYNMTIADDQKRLDGEQITDEVKKGSAYGTFNSNKSNITGEATVFQGGDRKGTVGYSVDEQKTKQ